MLQLMEWHAIGLETMVRCTAAYSSFYFWSCHYRPSQTLCYVTPKLWHMPITFLAYANNLSLQKSYLIRCWLFSHHNASSIATCLKPAQYSVLQFKHLHAFDDSDYFVSKSWRDAWIAPKAPVLLTQIDHSIALL
ncbi:hypothetical protein CGH69_04680 [Vibrio parahaemolyticus]|nr:hypothetical protein CGH69_04680 [Vibrio parahaemolyticus]